MSRTTRYCPPGYRSTCDAVALPFAEQLERPSKDHTTRVIEGITLAKTARGAISLDIPAGMADRAALQLLVLDDQSLSLTRGDKVFYAFATLPDGTTVETEGIGNGCGCEKTTDPSGKVTRKALPR